MRNMKKMLCAFLAVLLCILPTTTAFASDSQISPQSDVDHYYVNKNKTLARSYGVNGSITEIELYFGSWAECSSHTITRNVTFSAAIDVLKLASALAKSALLGGGGLTLSASYSTGGSRTFTAEQSRASDIGIFREYKYYTVDTYYVSNYGHVKNESFCGTSTIKEPVKVTLKVVYEDEL